jgi:hypothetical protein
MREDLRHTQPYLVPKMPPLQSYPVARQQTQALNNSLSGPVAATLSVRVCRFAEGLGFTSHHGVRDQKSVEESEQSLQALRASTLASTSCQHPPPITPSFLVPRPLPLSLVLLRV